MNQKLLTVVIPTFNMQAYLGRCLDSLIINNKFLNKVEILIINDGSSDCSSEIAHGYETKYSGIFRVIDKENGNYGSCVNRGLAESKGKYFRLLDADDWFSLEDFERFVGFLEDCDSDVVLTNYCQRFIDRNVFFTYPELISGKVYQIDEFPTIKNALCMHALTFRKELLIEIGLRHQEGISYTDIEYDYFPLAKASTLSYFSLNLYQYYIGREGQTVSNISFIKNRQALMKVAKRVLSDFVLLKDLSNPRKQILTNIILFPIYRIYLINLIFEKTNEDFSQLEQIILANNELKKKTNKSTYRKVPFVYIWRKFGIKCRALKFI